jgi:hypothetical protein
LSDIIPSAPGPRPLPFRRPADYYAAPLSEVRPIFPPWVPYGCGAASLLVIVLLFVAGSLAGSGKAGSLIAALFGTMQDEIRGIFTREVTVGQQKVFDGEMTALRRNLEKGYVSMDRLQPLLHAIRDASIDSKITPEEAKMLTKAAHDLNVAAGSLRATRNAQP